MTFKKYLVFFMVLGLSTAALAAGNPKIEATKINVFKPMVPPTKVKHGFCWMNSSMVARPDAWRCMFGNAILDPCFSVGAPDMVICGADPVRNEAGFFLRLTEPLPQIPILQPPPVNAWIIELEDDKVCKPYTGTMPVILKKGKALALQYGCETGENGELSGLLNDSIVPGKIWRAKKMTYISTDTDIKILKIQRVNIKEVWQ